MIKYMSEAELAKLPYTKLCAIGSELDVNPASWCQDDLLFLLTMILERQKAKDHLLLVK